ncbi:hypothetical protein KC347_g115 [Hortaea werneckii]|nr:hypothetical protein KC347_g115 [Hortaea werneckii]
MAPTPPKTTPSEAIGRLALPIHGSASCSGRLSSSEAMALAGSPKRETTQSTMPSVLQSAPVTIQLLHPLLQVTFLGATLPRELCRGRRR